jgi:hypothetical protein
MVSSAASSSSEITCILHLRTVHARLPGGAGEITGEAAGVDWTKSRCGGRLPAFDGFLSGREPYASSIIKGGSIIAAQMGDPNASIPLSPD